MEERLSEIHSRVQASRDGIVQFMRDICPIPGLDGQLKDVGERITAEMKSLGFDEASLGKMGNLLGRIGSVSRAIVYDSHIDTVGVGDPSTWDWGRFKDKVENGLFYARGACDEKCSTAGMIHGPAIADQLGLLEGGTVYYLGNMEEWCDAIAPTPSWRSIPGGIF